VSIHTSIAILVSIIVCRFSPFRWHILSSNFTSVATVHKWFQNSFVLCVWCVSASNQGTQSRRNLRLRETHFTSLQYVWMCVRLSFTNQNKHNLRRLREDWERRYRTLIGIFVPTHFHQLCKFLWTFSWNLWCQSFVSVLCVRVNEKERTLKHERVCAMWGWVSILSLVLNTF
jgi:hypothetical protein